MPRCAFIKKDGKPCLAWAIHDHERCVFHVEGDVRKALREKPLSREEQILIISRQLKALQRSSKDSPLEKAREIRSLVMLLKELQEGKPPDDNGKADPLKSKLEKWKHQT
jgi:hypothetical protein